MSSSFHVGLTGTVAGAGAFKKLAQDCKDLKVELVQVGEAADVSLNGMMTKAIRFTIKNYNGLTDAKKNDVKQAIKNAHFNKVTSGTYKEVNDSLDNVVKTVDRSTKAYKAQQDAIEKARKELERLEQREQIRNKNAGIRASKAGDERIRVANDLEEKISRRRDQSKLDAQDRANRQSQLMQKRHSLAMQRINAYNSGGIGGGIGGGILPAGVINGGIAKVLAYDALRRTLTNIYQHIGQIGDKIKEWTVESLNFNDELERSRTVFAGLGILGKKNADGSQMTLSQAEASSNPSIKAAYGQSQDFADNMMRRMMAVTVETGQDMNEIVASSRQLMPDLINKRQAKGNSNSALLENPEMFADVTERMVRLAAVFKMSDPAGRKLGWHMTSIQELFSGTSGGKKDTGMEMVKSLRTREGIRMDAKTALPISQAVNKGELDKAALMIEDFLEKSGQGASVIKNQQRATLGPNIEAVKTAFKAMGGDFTRPLWEHLKNNFFHMREGLVGIMKNPEVEAKLKKAGKIFTAAFDPIVAELTGFIDDFIKGPDKYIKMMRNMSLVAADGVAIWLDGTKAIARFTGVFLGITTGNYLNTEPFKKFIAQANLFAPEVGTKMQEMFNKIITAMTPLIENSVPAFIASLAVINELMSVLGASVNAISELNDTFGGFMTNMAMDIVLLFANIGISIRKLLLRIPGSEAFIDAKALQADIDFYDPYNKEADKRYRDGARDSLAPVNNNLSPAENRYRQLMLDKNQPHNPLELLKKKAEAVNALNPPKPNVISVPRPTIYGTMSSALSAMQVPKIGVSLYNSKTIPVNAKVIAENMKVNPKPIQINPSSMKVEHNYHINGITVAANTLQDIFNIVKAAGAGKSGNQEQQGPQIWPTKIQPGMGAARGSK